MTTISFTAYGIPKGQPRARAFARNGKVRMYDPGTAEGWKACVAAAAMPFVPKQPITEPVVLGLVFRMPRPKRLKSAPSLIPHLAKPDADNIAKAVMDCLTEIGMWVDDSLIYHLSVTKQYCEPDARPGCKVTLVVDPMEVK